MNIERKHLSAVLGLLGSLSALGCPGGDPSGGIGGSGDGGMGPGVTSTAAPSSSSGDTTSGGTTSSGDAGQTSTGGGAPSSTGSGEGGTGTTNGAGGDGGGGASDGQGGAPGTTGAGGEAGTSSTSSGGGDGGASSSMSSSSTGAGGCDAGFDDCDGDLADGCESLDTAENCGACGESCLEPGRSCTSDGICERSPVLDLDVGHDHACVVLDDAGAAAGRVLCWGRNKRGQLGDGTLVDSFVPVTVAGITNATSVATGTEYTCATLLTGQVRCWGLGVDGQLGNGVAYSLPASPGSPQPVTVRDQDGNPLAAVRSVEVDYQHTCAVHDGGGVSCWGLNRYGGLGDGTTNPSNTAVSVQGLPGSATRVTLANETTCAVLAGGTAACWGENGYGQFGNGTTSPTSNTTPTLVGTDGILEMVTVYKSSGNFTCALRSSAVAPVQCWGNAPYTSTPNAVAGLTGVDRIFGGNDNVCVRRLDGGVSCWGHNRRGEHGRGTANPDGNFSTSRSSDIFELVSDTALDVEGVATPIRDVHELAISSTNGLQAGSSACVLRTDGEVWCAGRGDALGDGQRQRPQDRWRYYPVTFLSEPAFEQVSCKDGIDGDGDGAADCADTDCATDASSVLAISGSLTGRARANYETPGCAGGASGREQRYLWTAPAAGTYRFAANSPTATIAVTVEETPCAPLPTAADCASVVGETAEVEIALPAQATIGVLVDAVSSTADVTTFQLDVTEVD